MSVRDFFGWLRFCAYVWVAIMTNACLHALCYRIYPHSLDTRSFALCSDALGIMRPFLKSLRVTERNASNAVTNTTSIKKNL